MTEPILTANELDALRDAVDADDSQLGVEGDRSDGVLIDGTNLPRFRFGQGPVGGTGREERLSYVFDRSARALERRLADILERSVSATVTFLHITRFSEFKQVFEVDVRELAMLGFRMAGQHGQGLLALEPQLVEKIVEGLMGGSTEPGAGELEDVASSVQRSVTNLDVRVCKRVMSGFLDDLGAAWNPVQPLECQVTSTDTTGVVARVYSDSSPVIAGLLEVSIEDRFAGMLGVLLPRGALDVLADPSAKEGDPEPAPVAQPEPWGPLSSEVPGFEVQFEVNLGTRRLTVGEFLALSEGDVLFLSGRSGATCTVQGVSRFVGVPGKKNGNKAIRIAEVIGRKHDET